MFRRALPLGLVLGCAASAEAQTALAFEFQGHHLGDTVWSSPKLTCAPGRGTLQKLCTEYVWVGRPLITASYVIEAGRIGAIQLDFKETDYPEMLATIRAKFGEPDSITTPSVQAKTGASFQNTVGWWRFADGVLQLERYGTSLTQSRGLIMSPAFERIFGERLDSLHHRAATQF